MTLKPRPGGVLVDGQERFELGWPIFRGGDRRQLQVHRLHEVRHLVEKGGHAVEALRVAADEEYEGLPFDFVEGPGRLEDVFICETEIL